LNVKVSYSPSKLKKHYDVIKKSAEYGALKLAEILMNKLLGL